MAWSVKKGGFWGENCLNQNLENNSIWYFVALPLHRAIPYGSGYRPFRAKDIGLYPIVVYVALSGLVGWTMWTGWTWGGCLNQDLQNDRICRMGESFFERKDAKAQSIYGKQESRGFGILLARRSQETTPSRERVGDGWIKKENSRHLFK